MQVNTGTDATSTMLKNCASNSSKFFLLTTAQIVTNRSDGRARIPVNVNGVACLKRRRGSQPFSGPANGTLRTPHKICAHLSEWKQRPFTIKAFENAQTMSVRDPKSLLPSLDFRPPRYTGPLAASFNTAAGLKHFLGAP